MIAVEPAAVPPPEPARPPPTGPGEWVRRNLFRSTGDGSSRWSSAASRLRALPARPLRVRHRPLGDRAGQPQAVPRRPLPADELWRISVAIAAIAGYAGVVAGFVGGRRVVAGRAPPGPAIPWWRRALDRRPAVAAARRRRRCILLLVTTAVHGSPLLGAVVAALVGRLLGPRLPGRRTVARARRHRRVRRRVLFLACPLDVTDWGGIMLNLFLAVAGITLCFPLGRAARPRTPLGSCR